MRKLFLIGAFVTGFMSLQAQAPIDEPGADKKPVDPKERATKQTEHMSKELGLTDAVKKQVYDVNFDAAKKMSEAKTKYASDKKVMQRERMKVESDVSCKMKTILSAAQYDKWIDMRIEQMHKHNKNKKKGNLPDQKMEPAQVKPEKLGQE